VSRSDRRTEKRTEGRAIAYIALSVGASKTYYFTI